METGLSKLVIPGLLFFAMIFVFFFITETFIVVFLSWFEEKKHDWLMIFMLRVYKHYRAISILLKIIAILIIILAIWLMWPILVSIADKPEVSILAVMMLAIITLLYFILTQVQGKLSIQKHGSKILYIILTMVLYFFILILMDQKFPNYRHYLYENVVSPTALAAETKLEAYKKKSLLNDFRKIAKEGKCKYKDYHYEKDDDVVYNFIYIKTDIEFRAKKSPRIPGSNVSTIQGLNCTKGEDTFLVTDYGDWYWVIEAEKKQVPMQAG